MLEQLDASERLFIWGFRSMAQSRRRAWPTKLEISKVYDHFRVATAVLSMEALLEAFECSAHTAIELHSPVCPCMSKSEFSLLQAVTATQHGRFEAARVQFERWLPPIATDWVMAAAQDVADLFRAAGFLLPERDTADLAYDKLALMQNWPATPPTLH
jgi:hypothetical protein